MPTDELPDTAPGRYVPYGARPYYLPEMLPPTAEIEFGPEFHAILQDAI